MTSTPITTSNIISMSNIANRQSLIGKVYSGYLHSPVTRVTSVNSVLRVTDWLTDSLTPLLERLVTLKNKAAKQGEADGQSSQANLENTDGNGNACHGNKISFDPFFARTQAALVVYHARVVFLLNCLLHFLSWVYRFLHNQRICSFAHWRSILVQVDRQWMPNLLFKWGEVRL